MSVLMIGRVWNLSQAEGTDRLVLLAIADNAQDDGEAFPGISRIALKCRISTRTVQRSIKKLESIGELEIKNGQGIMTASGPTNRYQINLSGRGDNLSWGDKQGGDGVTNRARRGDIAVSPKPSVEPSGRKPSVGVSSSKPKYREEVELEVESTSNVSPAIHLKTIPAITLAESIYSHYPLKVAKPMAIRSILKALKTESFDVLLNKTKSFLEIRGGGKTQKQHKDEFCPHPATWFNQERYNDDPETWKPKIERDRFAKPEVEVKMYASQAQLMAARHGGKAKS